MALKAVKCKKCGVLLGEFLEGSHMFCPRCRQWNQAPGGQQWDGIKKRQPRRSYQEMQRVGKNRGKSAKTIYTRKPDF